MKSITVIVLLFFLEFLPLAQILENSHGLIFEGRPEFSVSFIRTHGIKTISGSFLTKADGDELRGSREACYYKFNRFGELTFEYRTMLGDTIYTIYVWDERSNLIIKRSADRYGFQSYHYRYDSKNRLIYSELRTCKYGGQDRFLYVPSEDMKVSSEKFDYVDLNDGAFKKSFLNSSGMVYREEFWYYNPKGKIIEQTAYQISGGGKSSYLYSYNDEGRLLVKKFESNVAEYYFDKYEYEYDAFGNIYAMKYYVGDLYKTDFQYVYDAKNSLLEAVIMQDVSSRVMTIIKYHTYTYH